MLINQEYIINKKGLTTKEVEELIKKNGYNKISVKKEKSIFKMFVEQFKDFMIILLLIASAFSFGVAIYEAITNNNQKTSELIISFIEPFIILIVVALNAMLGTYQEIKSNQAVKALSKSNELYSKVYRQGKLITIPSSNLVVGDLIVIEAGDIISADAQLVESYSFYVVESALTGESISVEKDANFISTEVTNLAEQKNKIFSGTYSTQGRAIAVVTAIGDQTEIGKINNLIQEQKVPLTPLQIKLNKLSKIFGIAGIILLFVTASLQIVIQGSISNNWTRPELYSNATVIGISLAVAAIPEGLITFTTVLLAIGVARMTREKVIIKSFSAIETIGSTSIICSDKTGTLTENKMKVVDFINYNKTLTDNKVLEYFVACCDATIHKNEKGEFVEVGDQTEIGILYYANDHNINDQNIYDNFKKIHSLPFDSDRKLMSVLLKENNQNFLITKGAPDVIFSKVKNLDKSYKEKVEELSNKSYRVLAIAKKMIEKDVIDFDDENDLEFVGLIAMVDPARVGVKESIQQGFEAGIKPIMITGDHLTTAVAIAKELGIFVEGDRAITGLELSNMDEEELKNEVKHISVYARVTPSDKLRIVNAWQSHNQVVAMTGDGVNDAPALKRSDSGIAMGITGTDVSKQAADMILTDDNFSTIVKAVKSGRETYYRIKSVILNLLISSITEIIVMLFGLFVFSFVFKEQFKNTDVIILSASQLLWINLLTHGLPSIALGMTPTDANVMKNKPTKRDESIFANGMFKELIIQSIVLSFASLLSYGLVGMLAKNTKISSEDFVKLTSSAMFITLGVGASLNSLNLMSKSSIVFSKFKKYKLVYLASSFSVLSMLIVTFIPGISSVFKIISLDIYGQNWLYWFVPIILSINLVIYSEFKKIYFVIKNYLNNKSMI
ncbi:cation-translocating P-type ATPase [Mycoplasma sp. CSL7491-lung]|uniref:cation-translocating P-type ATPase n=1 Tax=Mycoplasma sp. CSL7491-lung TaxID=549718 RepID=UPI001C103111|nr:cation-translocating P-type ATPase [Mycoplasma sp. CSL7491-lung]MBU4693254.1 cation-translocating P-type ATPase [Mycoplasma sp. CSL7491-lung]